MPRKAVEPVYEIKKLTPITKELFPIGKPVKVESFIDSACGWEFDAPMHVMFPFHRYYIVGSNCKETVEDKIESLLFDLEFGEVEQSKDTWPYDKSYLQGLYRRMRKGEIRRGISYYKTTIVVKRWSGEEHDLDVRMTTTEQDRRQLLSALRRVKR